MMAQMGDILSRAQGSDLDQPIYRIKPGTHAHVINYQLIEEKSDLMDKVRSGVPEVEHLRLDFQRECAITELQKLITDYEGTIPHVINHLPPAAPNAKP
ncbi:hypothetical protein M5D96_000081 [Drosophila gunungcola]|uniref:Uncharacterized protein n=2 Tax=Drosophila gunungcola TaxID=103775 RepID=A0A9P9YW19_9MUSC|nr:hypothetical protein M5D96_000081 [Drosophila gunungcola]